MRPKNPLLLFLEDDLLGVRFALNVFIGGMALWLLLDALGMGHPVWAIASMIASSEPVVKNAVEMFRARIINALVGCVVGLTVLVIGGDSHVKLPIAMALAVLISSYGVRIHTMWRQAPITAAIILAADLTEHSRLSGVEHGLRKVGEVIIGCLMGLLVSWLMARVWPVREAAAKPPSRGAGT